METGEVLLVILRLLLALLLYAFLAALLVLLWSDLRRSAVREAFPRQESRLVVEAGKGGPQPGTVFPLQEVNSLGRAPANTVVLPDPFVSAHHALLTWREGHWWLEDLGSKNGTTLNDEPVTRPTIVGAGDLIGIGRITLRMEVGDQPRSA